MIILVGYRGAGKSTVAQDLSRLLGWPIISTDQEIIRRVGPINRFVKIKGWQRFREIESEVVKGIMPGNNIIDCGGGVIEKDENILHLRTLGTVFFLHASPGTLRSRIMKETRPSLSGGSYLQEIEQVLAKRLPLYKKAADIYLSTERTAPKNLAQEILRIILCRVCIPLTAKTIETAQRDMQKAQKYADIIEFRADYASDPLEMMRVLLANRNKPIIVTCRRHEEGGRFAGDENERLYILQQALALDADYVDVECETLGLASLFANRHFSRIILSHHEQRGTPSLEELEKRYLKMQKHDPDIIKIVTTARSVLDTAIMQDFLKHKHRCIGLCMGIHGQVSRVLAPKWGSWSTFICLEPATKSAAGQVTLKEAKRYRIKRISPKTRVYGLLGKYAEYSCSKDMHNRAFAKLGIDAVYVPFKLAKEELRSFMGSFRRSLSGGSVTQPHKVTVMEFVDEVAPAARGAGAVNTLLIHNGKLIGENTDVKGVLVPLEKRTTLKKKSVLVLGAGGVAMAVCFALSGKGARIIIANRTPEKAKLLAEMFGCIIHPFVKIHELNPAIIINATSVGMMPYNDTSIIKNTALLKNKIVFDLVYRPKKTRLLRDAEALGATIIEGWEMLLYQGMEQFRLWTGKEPDEKEMRTALLEVLR